MNNPIKFKNKDQSAFLLTLKDRVDHFFVEQKVSRHANAFMVFKTVLFLSLATGLYVVLLMSILPLFLQFIAAILLGMTLAFIGFNICHDALHGAYSSNQKVNKLLGFIFNVMGANTYLWNLTHNKVHHSFTNIVDHDEDIEIAPGLIRVHESDKANKLQRFQHIYAFFLYSLTMLSWVFRKDYLKFFKKKIGESHVNQHPKAQYYKLFLYKALYYSLFIVLPLLVMSLTWWQFLIGFVVMHLAQGLVLGLVFQLAHVVEDTEICQAENNVMEDAWAVHQMKTTANFAPTSRLANFLCGGLNLQVEHHLFPKICHVHYKRLSAIVRQTALEFNLPYHVNRSFFSALRSHYLFLKRLGRPVAV